MARLSPGRRQQAIAAWAAELDHDFADRVLPLTREVAGQTAVIADQNLARGLQPGWPDMVIAATAAFHGMTLLTRNVCHFTAAGIPVIDPFTVLPE